MPEPARREDRLVARRLLVRFRGMVKELPSGRKMMLSDTTDRHSPLAFEALHTAGFYALPFRARRSERVAAIDCAIRSLEAQP